MKLNRTGSLWDRNQRNGINENWHIIEGDYKNIVDNVSNKAYQQVVDSAKLNWKDPVDNQNALPSSANEGDTRMARDTGKVYRYNGSEWQEIQQIDAGPVNELDSRVSAQLTQITNYSTEIVTNPTLYKNATEAIDISTIHAVVEYIPEGFGGHRYWMAGTPYAGFVEDIENPHIYYSDDGENWEQPSGVNPLSPPPSATGEQGEWHNSDTFLLYRKDIKRIEVWWRRRVRVSYDPLAPEIILRRTSYDGVNWSPEEELFRYNNSSAGDNALSPSGIYNYNTGKYESWLIKANVGNTTIPDKLRCYHADGGGKNWELVDELDPVFQDGRERQGWRIWHGSVSKTSELYELVVTAGSGNANNNMELFYSTATDGIHFGPLIPMLSPKNDETDSTNIYHGCLTKTNEGHIIYYSGRNGSGVWTLNRSFVPLDKLNSGFMNNTKSMFDNAHQKLNYIENPNLIDLEHKVYINLTEIPYVTGGWAWPGGMSVNTSQVNRRSLNKIPVSANTEYEIKGFSSFWNCSVFIGDSNDIMTSDIGWLNSIQPNWREDGYKITTGNNDAFLYITIRKDPISSIGEGEFEENNPNATVSDIPYNNHYIREINQLRNDVTDMIKHFELGFGKEIKTITSGKWTHSGVSNGLGFVTFTDSDETRVRSVDKLALSSNHTYLIKGLENGWEASYYLLDNTDTIVFDSGRLSNTNPNFYTEGVIATPPPTATHIVFNIHKDVPSAITVDDYMALNTKLSIRMLFN